MEWQQIIGFCQVAKLGSFTKAGEATFRTQSALSQQIKALEKELGCRLFERTGKRGSKLTPAGEAFLGFAEAVLTRYEGLREELDELLRVPRGCIRIAAPFTTLYHLLPEKIKEYRGLFPQVELTLLDRSQERVIQMIRDGDVDFGFALESVVPKDCVALRWEKVETVLMVQTGHPLASERRVTLEAIAEYPLILPPKNLKYAGRARLEDQFHQRGLDYRVVMESSNVELSSIFVEMDLGISLATIVRGLPSMKERGLEFLPMDHYFEPDHIALIMKRNKTIASYKNTFLNVLLGNPVSLTPSVETLKDRGTHIG